MATRARQRGWAGLFGLLIALAIVLLLGRTVLQHMGVLAPHPSAAATPMSRQLAPDAASAEAASGSSSTIAAPLERARSAEAIVQQHVRDSAAGVERTTQ